MNEPKYILTKKDLEITWFSGSGAGGQHRNKHDNCCRIRHPETGVIAVGQSHKERRSNQKEALESLVAHYKFKNFLASKLKEVETGIKIEEAALAAVEECMKDEHIKEIESQKDFKLMIKGKKKEVIDGVEIWSDQ